MNWDYHHPRGHSLVSLLSIYREATWEPNLKSFVWLMTFYIVSGSPQGFYFIANAMAAMSGKLMSLVLAAMLLDLAMAANYTVGGPTGSWDSTTNLQSWAAGQSFLVGDSLIFQYAPTHDVLEVSQADHDSCQASSPLQSYTGGTTIAPLSSPGKRYFICGTPGHCSAGMKLEVNTLVSITPPPASSVTPAPVSPISLPPTESPVNPSPVASPVVPFASSPLPENSIPSPTIESPLNPSPAASPVVPFASLPLPENSIPSPTISPELTPTSSPSPINLPLPAPSSAAMKYSFPVSLTTGLALIPMMMLLGF